MVRTHQPGEAAFRSILPEDIDWKPFAAFPPTVRLAVLVGEPSQPGPYVVRVRVQSGLKLMPHRHPEDRIYTVMSGIFYIGLGDQFDGDRVKANPHLTSIGLNRESTSRRSRRSERLVSNIRMRTTIRGTRAPNWPSREVYLRA